MFIDCVVPDSRALRNIPKSNRVAFVGLVGHFSPRKEIFREVVVVAPSHKYVDMHAGVLG